ncbi:hypothetical protein ALC62_02460, partial [Cyphomyrmex costatus]
EKNDLSEYGQRIFCITNGDLSVKLGRTSSKPRKRLFEARARIVGQADIYVKTGSLLTLTCLMSQGPHDLGTVAWYRGSDAVVTSPRSENDIETEPRITVETEWSDALTSKSETTESFVTWLAHREDASDMPRISGDLAVQPGRLCRSEYCAAVAIVAVVSAARPFLDVIDDYVSHHNDAVTHRGKFTGPQPKKRINCRAAVGPRLPSCKRPLSVNSMGLSESTADDTFS